MPCAFFGCASWFCFLCVGIADVFGTDKEKNRCFCRLTFIVTPIVNAAKISVFGMIIAVNSN